MTSTHNSPDGLCEHCGRPQHCANTLSASVDRAEAERVARELVQLMGDMWQVDVIAMDLEPDSPEMTAVSAALTAQRQAGRNGERETDSYGRCVPSCGCRDCGRPRMLAQRLIAVIGATGPESAEETVDRANLALLTTKQSESEDEHE